MKSSCFKVNLKFRSVIILVFTMAGKRGADTPAKRAAALQSAKKKKGAGLAETQQVSFLEDERPAKQQLQRGASEEEEDVETVEEKRLRLGEDTLTTCAQCAVEHKERAAGRGGVCFSLRLCLHESTE